MDVKIENDCLLALCQGCLSADRKLARVTDHNKAIFIKLRDDFKQCKIDTTELKLCFECIALLNKMKQFQVRIKTAQYRLVQYLHSLYENDLHTLSSLTNTKQKNEYDYKYNNLTHSEDQRDFNPNDKELLPEKKELVPDKEELVETDKDDEYLELNIKEENDDSSIKEEYDNMSNDNDLEFDETDLKREPEAFVPNKKFPRKQSIKHYERYATVIKKNERFTKKDNLGCETVHLSEKEIDVVLQRERKNIGYKRMPFKCEICVLGYKRRLDLLRHRTLNHDKSVFPSTCSACKTKIESRAQLEEHWRDYHTSMLRCSMCSQLCRSDGEMKKHLNRSHTKTYRCNDCQQECSTLRDFSVHYKKSHEWFVCDHCNSSFASKRRLESHIKRNHLPSYCSICNKTYRTYDSFEIHLRIEHPELISSDTRKELRYCVECDKQYPSIYKYRRHLQQSARHTPRKVVRVPCRDCDKIFTRTSYMNNHYRLVHMKNSKHYCDLCNKYFANGYGVRKHIQYVHKKIPMPKDKICDLCGRGFSTNRILTNHRRTHTGERPFKCTYCPASFAQKTAMNSHQKTQHKNLLPLPS